MHSPIYNSRNLYKVLNLEIFEVDIIIYNSRNLYKVLNNKKTIKNLESTIVEIYIRY